MSVHTGVPDGEGGTKVACVTAGHMQRGSTESKLHMLQGFVRQLLLSSRRRLCGKSCCKTVRLPEVWPAVYQLVTTVLKNGAGDANQRHRQP